MKELFSGEFSDNQPFSQIKTREVLKVLPDIDKLIEEAAPEWPTDKINKIDLAILRLAVFELMFEKEVPPKVAIDEAVEIAKEYGAESSPAFINGALGKLVTTHNLLT